MVDYIIHYVKSNGKTSPKVFKGKTCDLSPNESFSFIKKVSFKEVTTRKYYKGVHKIELQINGVTSTNANTDTPGDNLFITETVLPRDWRVPQNDNLWQGESGVNNPCPSGYRLASENEWNTLLSAENITNISTGYNSSLALTANGRRFYGDGLNSSVGSTGYYWSLDFLVFSKIGNL